MLSWLFGKRNGVHEERRGERRKTLEELKNEVLEQTASMDPDDHDAVTEMHRMIDEEATKRGVVFEPEESPVSAKDETKIIPGGATA